MKKILVTGVAGFIGSKIASKLINNKKYKVFGVDNLSQGKIENIPNNVEFIKGDLSVSNFVNKLPKKIDQILHLAGQSSGEKSFDNPILDLNKNIKSSLNLINYGIDNNARRFVYASSMSVYGAHKKEKVKENDKLQPLSCYGVSKLAVENYLTVYKKKLPYVILRMFNVYGPGQDFKNLKQGMVSIYLSQAIKNNNIIVKGPLNRTRDLIYIDDVVDIWINILKNEKIFNKIYNVGTGKSTSVKKILQKIQFYYNNLKIIEKNNTPGDQKNIIANINLLKRDLKFNKFIEFDDGLKKFIKNI